MINQAGQIIMFLLTKASFKGPKFNHINQTCEIFWLNFFSWDRRFPGWHADRWRKDVEEEVIYTLWQQWSQNLNFVILFFQAQLANGWNPLNVCHKHAGLSFTSAIIDILIIFSDQQCSSSSSKRGRLCCTNMPTERSIEFFFVPKSSREFHPMLFGRMWTGSLCVRNMGKKLSKM